MQPTGSSSPSTNEARSALNVPSIMLMVVAGLSMLFSLAALASSDTGMMQMERELHPDRVYMGGGSLIPRWANAIPLLFSALIAWGAWRMRSLKDFRLSIAVCVMSMLPCFMPCCFLSIPASIWALTVLLKPEVKSAFT